MVSTLALYRQSAVWKVSGAPFNIFTLLQGLSDNGRDSGLSRRLNRSPLVQGFGRQSSAFSRCGASISECPRFRLPLGDGIRLHCRLGNTGDPPCRSLTLLLLLLYLLILRQWGRR